MIVQAANGEKMMCKSVCKGLKWKMQGVCLEADAFIIELRYCDMVPDIQWLSMLGDILCNYKHLWMSLVWQGDRVLLKWENLVKFQAIKIEQISSLVGNHKQLAEYHLYSLRIIEDDDYIINSMTAKLPFNKHSDATLQSMLEAY